MRLLSSVRHVRFSDRCDGSQRTNILGYLYRALELRQQPFGSISGHIHIGTYPFDFDIFIRQHAPMRGAQNDPLFQPGTDKHAEPTQQETDNA